MKTHAAGLGLAVLILSGASCFAGDPLAEGFAEPPAEAKPQVWWHWMNGNVSREGITADLEAMARLGLGGVQKFDLGGSDNPAGPVRVYSREYDALMKHAVAEAARLGLEFGAHNCPGFSVSGGPWVPKEQAMKMLAYTETVVEGGRPFSGELAAPDVEVAGTYRDVAIYAWPEPAGARQTLWTAAPTVTTSMRGESVEALRDGKGAGLALKAADGWSPWIPEAGASVSVRGDWVRFDFAQPVELRSVRLRGKGRALLAVEGAEGHDAVFHVLGTIDTRTLSEFPDKLAQTIAFPATNVRALRLRIAAGAYRLAKVDADNAAVVQDIVGKAAFAHQYEMTPGPAETAPGAVIDPATVLNLTDRLVADGKLRWTPPPGRWVVMRLGYGALKKTNHPAEEAGQGFECDKLDRDAVANHLENALGPLLAAAGENAGRVFTNVLFDSYEAGGLNWTPRFVEEFKARRGYDPLPWGPVFSGRVIKSSEASERFLWDFRRTLGDLIDENYFGVAREILHRHGLRFALESYGNVWGEPFDTLRVAKHADLVMNEFWGTGRPGAVERVTGMPDAGHVHGLRVVGAEAYTAAGNWDTAPYDLKAWGDRMFSRGVNRFYFHASPHQPWSDPRGGVWFVPLHFHRGNTWFAEAGDYVRYLARCQYLLQAGRPSADILYCYGEDTPLRLNTRQPVVPAGFSLDACPAELVIAAGTVADNGDVVLPSGMRYRVLLLPPDPWMTPELLTKVDALARAGATVLGRRPERSPSAVGQPTADETVRRLAAALWPDSTEPGEMRAVGKGRVVNAWDAESVRTYQREVRKHHQAAAMDAGLARVLPKLGLSPDLTWRVAAGAAKAEVNWIRRRLEDGGDLYFVANGTGAPLKIEADFRIDGVAPQLWFPDTGGRYRAADFKRANGRTRVTLELDPAASVFVVFRAADPGLPEFRPFAATAEQAIAGPWTVTFQRDRGAPGQAMTWERLASLTQSAEPGIRYFSGTTTYRTTFRVEKTPANARLNLGDVNELAGVTLNGRELGTLWKPPYVVELGEALRAGENELEVRVTNVWHNRMVGDEHLSEDADYANPRGAFGQLRRLNAWPEWLARGEARPTARVFFSSGKYVTEKTPLRDAGLLGPVKLEFGR